MSYTKNGYQVIKNAIPIDVANFVYDYFMLKSQVGKTMRETTYISKYDKDWGESGDIMCPTSYCHYSDIAMETILNILTPKMSRLTKLDLTPTYSYARIYETNDDMRAHTDRYSCEVSTTLNLGGSHVFPIWLKDRKGKQHEIKLEPSDMLIYRGCELEHWRNKFEGDICTQVFLHYNEVNEKSKDNLYDGRLHLGLPAKFKGLKIIRK